MIGAGMAGLRSEASFLAELVGQFRAQDASGAWNGKTDFELLEPLIVPRDARRAQPEDEDPDPDVFWRIELFYSAVGVAIARRTGVVCFPMLKMHHEGFGRVVLVAGRLVVVDSYLRGVQRFGFESVDKLAEAGERLVAEAVELVERFPEVARFSS
jgi:probable nitrogen fixation protein